MDSLVTLKKVKILRMELKKCTQVKNIWKVLNDGRVVYLNGEKIKDVTTHPAYRNSARSYARMYDALHDPATRDILTTTTEYGDKTHKFFKTPTSAQDLLEARDAIAEWARLSYGFMGRTPDYKASFIGTSKCFCTLL